MINRLQKRIDLRLPFLKSARLLVAVSGGIDSVALAHLCHELGLDIALAHCNFNLRGEESDADEAYVLQLAERLNREVFTQHFNTERYAKSNKLSIQMAARELRYQWFEELAKQLKFDYILTAHHADDNLETFLINLSRGTGLDGLNGIPEINNKIVRPLLSFSKEAIEMYAKSNQLKWREDSSNSSNKYLRNALRHEVIPKLKELNPSLLQNFQNTQNHLEGTRQLVEDAIAKVQKKVVSVEGDVITFYIKKLKKLSNPKAYLYELLKDFNFTQWDDVVHLLDAQSGKYVFSESHRLLKDREVLLLTEINNNTTLDKNEASISISEKDTKVETPLGILFFDEADALFGKTSHRIYVDKDLLNFPLIVRHWEKGDYFYPSGMQGKKKISKFFKDEKLSLVAKEKSLLLCSGNDIVWIINQRADNRFKVTDKTKSILKITLQ